MVYRILLELKFESGLNEVFYLTLKKKFNGLEIVKILSKGDCNELTFLAVNIKGHSY